MTTLPDYEPMLYVGASKKLARIYVWYMGSVVAYADVETGTILWRSAFVPLYLIEYLLMLPRPDETQWN